MCALRSISKQDQKQNLTIAFLDMVGYSRSVAEDEALGMELLQDYRQIVREAIGRFQGSEVRTIGDGFFIVFEDSASAVFASEAILFQCEKRNTPLPEKRKLRVRIGLHSGEVTSHENDHYGNAVNIAARVESVATPGSLCITETVFQSLGSEQQSEFHFVGKKRLKNIPNVAKLYEKKAIYGQSINKSFLYSVKKQLTHLYETVQASESKLTEVFFLVLCALLVSICSRTLFDYLKKDATQASLNSENEFRLHDQWEFTEALPSANFGQWKVLASESPWRGETLRKGQYWFRKFFTPIGLHGDLGLRLGLIGDWHQVFLNGDFIGGSTHWNGLANYAVDSKKLKLEKTNELRVRAHYNRAEMPSLYRLPEDPASFVTWETSQHRVSKIEFRVVVLQSIYLAFGILSVIAFGVLGFTLHSRKKTLFLSIVLAASCLELTYLNPFFSDVLDFQTLEMLNRVSFVLMNSFFSVLLFESLKKRRLSLFFQASGVLGTGLFFVAYVTQITIDRSFAMAGCAFIAGLGFVISVFYHFKNQLSRIQNRTFFSLLVWLGMTSTCLICASYIPELRERFEALVIYRNLIREGVSVIPFLISLGLGVLSLWESIQTQKKLESRSEFLFQTMRVIEKIRNAPQLKEALIELLTQFQEEKKVSYFQIDFFENANVHFGKTRSHIEGPRKKGEMWMTQVSAFKQTDRVEIELIFDELIDFESAEMWSHLILKSIDFYVSSDKVKDSELPASDNAAA